MVQRKDVRLMLAKDGWSIAVKQVIDRPDVSNKLLSGLVEKFMNIIDKESEVLLQSSQAYIAKEKLSKEDYEPDVIELQVDKTKNEHHYSHDTDHHSNVDADVKAFWGALDGKAKTDVTHKTNTTKDDVYETDKQLQGRKRYFNDLFLVSDILTLIEQQHQLDYEESYRTRQTDAHTHTITFENYDYSPEPTSEPEAPVKDADFVADINGTPLDMVWVEGGTFRMGGTDDEACDSEKPVHEVTLSGFYISRYPVTQAQYYAVMGSNPSHFGGSNRLPVDNVSWDNAQEFCRKLNAQTVEKGLPAGYRLLTEAEWEYGARGGQKSKGYKYAGSDELGDVAHFSVNSGGSTQIVGLKKPNELGLYDMSGNVWEWCQDWYGSYKAEAQANPHGPQSGNYRVLRGGSWGNLAVRCRLARRDTDAPADHFTDCGFRLALPSRA
ncbi:MAG: formylglycine-generating enzyme family protein [Sphingobacteriales bacterium]|nr:formylglycine-generating enzyme family protein [Sphingobacteriales bacterium]